MAVEAADGGVVGDRDLIEDAVKLLLGAAPVGWTRLHGEFEPPAVAAVSAVTPDGMQSVTVPDGVLSVVGEHQRRAAAAGAPWQRLVVDCQADGQLSARTEPHAPASELADGSAVSAAQRSYRWLRPLLVAVTVGCAAAAAVVFAVAWKWSPPPRADVIVLPAPPPREKEAFDVISKWLNARNLGDAAGMRAMACAQPLPAAAHLIDRIQQFGQTQYIVYPDAITEFRDDQTQLFVTLAERAHPLDEHMRQRVADEQKRGGFFVERFVLVDDGGALKVCDDNAGD